MVWVEDSWPSQAVFLVAMCKMYYSFLNVHHTLWYRNANASRRRQSTKPLRFNSCSFVLVVLVSAHEGTEIVEFPITRAHRSAGGSERACNFL